MSQSNKKKSWLQKLMERPERKRRRAAPDPGYYHINKRHITYASDGLWAYKNLSGFIDDEKFIQSYYIGVNSGQNMGVDENNDIKWRTHVICWAAKYASRLEGDYAECGVNTGLYSLAAMNWIDFDKIPDRKWWLLDTYCGLDISQQDNEEDAAIARARNEHHYPDCYEIAKSNFSKYANAILVKGRVPDTLVQVTSKKIAYLSIDMNYYFPEIAAGHFFWDSLVNGAVIVLDDYAHPGFEKQNDEWNKFAKEKNIQILTLMTGQGLILKTP